MITATVNVFGARNKALLTEEVKARSIDSVMVQISKALRKHRGKANSGKDDIANWRDIQIIVDRVNKKIGH